MLQSPELSERLRLQDSGIVAIGDMARRFRLGSELMQSIIVARLESVIGGRMESGILFTSMYITRVKSQVVSSCNLGIHF